MDVGVVERVILSAAGGHAAGLARARHREHLEDRRRRDVRIGQLVGVVVADGRPQVAAPERGLVHVEHRGLVLRVRAVLVGVVAEQQDEVGVLRLRPRGVRIAHAHLAVARSRHARRSRVAEDPHARQVRGVRRRGRDEEVIGVPAGERLRRRADRVVVRRARRQPGQRDDVLGRRDGDVDIRRQRGRIGAEAHPAVGRDVGPPTHDLRRRRSHLQVRPARDRLRAHGQRGDRNQADQQPHGNPGRQPGHRSRSIVHEIARLCWAAGPGREGKAASRSRRRSAASGGERHPCSIIALCRTECNAGFGRNTHKNSDLAVRGRSGAGCFGRGAAVGIFSGKLR